MTSPGGLFPSISPSWWVLLTIPANMQQSNVHASVVGPFNPQQAERRYPGITATSPNPRDGFATKLQAQAAANKYNANPDKAGGVNAPGLAPGLGAPSLAGPSGLAAIGDLASRLTQPSTWVRVGEFLAGGILVFIGVNAMTKGPARSATQSTVTKTAKTAVKAGKAIAK